MTLSTGPNLGQLVHGLPGEGHYSELIRQWRALDALVQPSVIARVASLPVIDQVDGDRYLLTATAEVDKIARWSDITADWEYFTPKDGWFVWSSDDQAGYRFKGDPLAWEDAIGSVGMSNPMTTAGDLIVGGSSGIPTRIGLGAALQVLRVNAAGDGVEYATPAGGSSSSAQVITESSTSRTLVTTDAGKFITFDDASASMVTVSAQADETWLDNAEVHIYRNAAGNLTLTPGSGVTLKAPSGGTLVMTDAMVVTLKRLASDVWAVLGQTVAV